MNIEKEIIEWYKFQKESWNGIFDRLQKIEKWFRDLNKFDNYIVQNFSCCAVCEFCEITAVKYDYRYTCMVRRNSTHPTGVCQRFSRKDDEDE